MHLPPALRAALTEPNAETALVIFMLLISLLLVAVAFERLFLLARVRISMRGVDRVVQTARKGTLVEAQEAAARLKHAPH